MYPKSSEDVSRIVSEIPSSGKLEAIHTRIDLDNETLTEEILGISRIGEMLVEIFGQNRIDFVRVPDSQSEERFSAILHQDKERLVVTGRSKLFGTSEIPIQIVFQEMNNEVQFEIRNWSGRPLKEKFSQIQGRLFTGLFRLPFAFLDFECGDFTVTFDPSSRAVELEIHGIQDLDLKNSIILKEPLLTISAHNLLSGMTNIDPQLRGTLRVSSHAVKVTGNILLKDLVNDPYVIAGDLGEIDFKELITALGASFVEFPVGFPSLSLPPSRIELRFMGSSLSIVVSTLLPDDWGQIIIVIGKMYGNWSYAAAVILSDKWKFREISGHVARLDELNFRTRIIGISSFEDPKFKFPDVMPLQGPVVALGKGINISTVMLLQSQSLELVGQILHETELKVAVVFKSSVSDVSVSAVFNDKIEVWKNLIYFIDTSFKIKFPTGFGLSSTAIVDLDRFPSVAGLVEFGPGDSALAYGFTFKEPWEDPAGVKGLTIENLTALISVPNFSIAIDGYLKLTNTIGLHLGLEFIPGTPIIKWFVGQINGSLSLQEVVATLVKVPLLDQLFPISIENPTAYIIPRKVELPGPITYDPGLELSGSLKIVELVFDSRFKVSAHHGIEAEGNVRQPIRFGKFLTISNKQGTAGPLVKISSSRSPFATVELRASLLQLIQPGFDAILDNSGFGFGIEGGLGSARSSISASFILGCRVSTISPRRFGINGTAEITAELNSSNILLGRNVFGSMTVRVTILTDIEANMSEDDASLKMKLSAHFVVLGRDIPILQFSLDFSEDSLLYICELVRKKAQEAMDKLLIPGGELLNKIIRNPSLLIQLVKDGILKLADNIMEGARLLGRLLEDLFGWSAMQIADVIQNTLSWGVDAVGNALEEIGKTFEEIGSVLQNLGNAPQLITNALKSLRQAPGDLDIARLLRDLRYDSQTISQCLSGIGVAAENIGNFLDQIGFGPEEIAKGLNELHIDSGRITSILRNISGNYNNSETIAKALHSIGIPDNTIAPLLKSNFNMVEAAKGLRSIGVPIDGNGWTLKNILGGNRRDVQIGLESGAGHTSQAVSDTIKKLFG